MASQAVGQSRSAEVLAVVEERDRAGEAPFGDVVELFDFMKEQGSDLNQVGMAVAVGRLVCEGRIWYALDGIRLVS